MKKITTLLALILSCGIILHGQTTVNLPDCNDCDPEITALDCGSATFNNTEFTSGEEFQAAMMVPYTGGNGQQIGALSVASTGVTGLTADLMGGGNLATGAGGLVFYVHGTPSGAGTASFEITFGGQTCTVDLVLTEAVTSSSASEGCASYHGAIDFARSPYEDGAVTYEIFIDSEGKLRGIGLNDFGYGTFGVGALTYDNDPNVMDNHVASEFFSPRLLPNFEAYLPNETFTQVEHYATTGHTLGAAITTTGKLYTWGDIAGAGAGLIWSPATGRTTGNRNSVDANIPHEIVAPNGEPWVQVYLPGTATMMFACTADGTWYSWGNGYEGVYGLAHTTSTGTSGLIDAYVPQPCAFPVLPECSNPYNKSLFLYGLNKVFLAADGTVRCYSITSWTFGGVLTNNSAITLPVGVTAQQVTYAASGQNSNILILGDDGNVYFVGDRSQVGPSGTLPGAFTGLTAVQIPMTSVPAGVTFTKVLQLVQGAFAIGTDGRLYAWNFVVDPFPLVDPEGDLSDIEEIWLSRTEELIYRKTDGSVWHLFNSVFSPTIFDNPLNTLMNHMVGFTPSDNGLDTNDGPYQMSCQ